MPVVKITFPLDGSNTTRTRTSGSGSGNGGVSVCNGGSDGTRDDDDNESKLFEVRSHHRRRRRHNLPLNLESLDGPEGLIGRTTEVKALLDLWKQVAASSPEELVKEEEANKSNHSADAQDLVWIRGDMGGGKSTLVRQTFEQLDGCLFVYGKFEQTTSTSSDHPNRPLSAIVDAITQLCDTLIKPLLVEAQKRLHGSLTKAELNILINSLPSLKRMIIEDTTTTSSEHEAQEGALPMVQSEFAFQRFCDVFKKFWRALCAAPQTSVCLFLDDLQWMDVESQQLIKSLAQDGNQLQQTQNAPKRHLLLIGATRELDTLPLWDSEDAGVDGACSTTEIIQVKALPESEVNQLVSKLMDCRPEKTIDFSRLVFQKTHGNPYFVLQYMEHLHSRSLIQFHFSTGQWQYDLEAIRATTNVSDNVVGILMEKLQGLPLAVQKMLRVAACLGFHFETIVLEQVLAKLGVDAEGTTDDSTVRPQQIPEQAQAQARPEEEDNQSSDPRVDCGEALDMAADCGLIENSSDHSFKFSHDGVQQSALELLPTGSKGTQFRLRLGEILLELSRQSPEKDWMLFAAVTLLVDNGYGSNKKDETLIVVQACRDAAARAKVKSAFEAAANYADQGLSLLCGSDPLCWQKDRTYSLCLELFTILSQASYSRGDYEKSDMAATQVISNAKRLEDKLLAYKVRIAIFGSRGDLHGGSAEGLKVIGLLGVELPLKPTNRLVSKELKKTSQLMKKQQRTPRDLAKLPMMTDPMHINAMRFLHTNTVYSWHAGEANLCVLQCLTMMQLTLKHGLCQFSPHAIAVYGGLMTNFGVLDEAFDYAKVSLELLERPNCREEAPITLKVVHLFLFHLRKPLYESLEPLLEGYRIGMESGDIQIASRILCLHSILCVIAGMPIGSLVTQIEGYCQFFREYRQHDCLMEVSPWLQFTRNLIGDGESSTLIIQLSGSVAEEEELSMLGQQDPLLREDLTIKLYTVMARIMLYCVYGEFRKSYEECQKTKIFENITYSFFMKPFLIFFSGFTYLCLAKEKKFLERRSLISKGRVNMKELKKFVKGGSVNYVPMLLLLEAEEYSTFNEGKEKVLKAYQSAIATAGRSGFRLIKAIACERAGQYCLRRGGDSSLANDYLVRAGMDYADYGAQSKCSHMEQKYSIDLAAPSTTHGGSAAAAARQSSLFMQPTSLEM